MEISEFDLILCVVRNNKNRDRDFPFRPGDVSCILALREDEGGDGMAMLSLPNGGAYGFVPLSDVMPINPALVLASDNSCN